MTTVFLSGSRKVTRLPKEVVDRLDSMIDSDLDIVVGDANGSDRLMQNHLNARQYRRVQIFHSGSVYRNNVGSWPAVQVEVEDGISGRDFYARKDRQMAEIADFGFVVWDGHSEGSITNARVLASKGKKSVIYVVPKHLFVVVRGSEDIDSLVAPSEITPDRQGALEF